MDKCLGSVHVVYRISVWRLMQIFVGMLLHAILFSFTGFRNFPTRWGVRPGVIVERYEDTKIMILPISSGRPPHRQGYVPIGFAPDLANSMGGWLACAPGVLTRHPSFVDFFASIITRIFSPLAQRGILTATLDQEATPPQMPVNNWFYVNLDPVARGVKKLSGPILKVLFFLHCEYRCSGGRTPECWFDLALGLGPRLGL